MPDLLANLNEPQHAAVTLPGVHALILAGAGSGKTRVLTTRIAWLIATGQVGPHGVLAVTFTNKAAREMLVRLSAMVAFAPRGMWVGTFHGLCNRLLRAHHRDAALPAAFQILDSQDQLALVRRVMREMKLDEQKFPPRQVAQFIAARKEEGRRPDHVIVADEFTARMTDVYRAYDAQCQREGVVDFAELLLRSVELLERNEPLREHYRRRFRHILVDEFQDTNDLQYRWLRLLAGPDTAIFAVGDDDQSIYAFRGANVANMAAFERDYAHDRLIKLEQNYRSHAHILDSANSLIRQNGRRLGKELWTDAGSGEPVRVHESPSDADEARWLLEQIRGLVADGAMRAQIAVLYRSNAQSRVIEHALFSAGVPYRVYGGLRFFERAEIKNALGYLRLVENPDDDGAFLRVVNFPARGIGARTLEQLQDHARRVGQSLYRAAPGISGTAAAKLRGFVTLVERLRDEAAGIPLTDVVDRMLELSGLLAHYAAERDGEERVENLRELVNAAASYLSEEGIATHVPASVGLARQATPLEAGAADAAAAGRASGTDAAAGDATAQTVVIGPDDVLDAGLAGIDPQLSPLAGFLAHASLEAGEGQAGEGVDSVQMMTVHAAKGLEFDNVFITGLEEGLFPHENAASDPDGLEEERRLMYVAITRARRRLHLSFAQSRMLHGQTRYNLRSRFIDELPDESLKWLSPKQGLRAASGLAGGGGDFSWGARQRDGGAARPRTGVAFRLPAGRNGSDDGPSDGGYRYAASGARFRAGQRVAHKRFGEGVILKIEGAGDDERAQINFGAHGVKWLALAVAKLDPV